MAAASAGGWKTCSRGHKYRGPHYPICWKGGTKTRRSAVKKTSSKKTK